MRRFGVVFVTLVSGVMMSGQQQPAALPGWLVPYAGAKAETQTALATRIEIAYTTDAKPDFVVAHYRHVLEGAGLPFLPSFDGIGTSMRAASEECDLLIKIREQGAGTLTSVSCAAKTTGSASAPNGVEVMSNRSTIPARTLSPQIEERTRRVLAEAEARHKQGIQKMEIYDQPVNGRSRKKGTPPRPEI
jgi:hypothetical protein